jgi:hypothetical protein
VTEKDFKITCCTEFLLSVMAEVIMEWRQNAKLLLHLTWITESKRLTMRMSVPTDTSIEADGSLLQKKKKN